MKPKNNNTKQAIKKQQHTHIKHKRNQQKPQKQHKINEKQNNNKSNDNNQIPMEIRKQKSKNKK